MYKRQVRSQQYILYEYYGYGYVKNELYKGNTQVPLNTLDATKSISDVSFDESVIPVSYTHLADFDTQELPSDPDKDEYPATEPEQKRGYSGFLYIKCPECGEARAFCSKHELTFYKCPDCGTKTPLDDMTPLYINCECGGRSRCV